MKAIRIPYLIARRSMQVLIFALFAGSNWFGLKILQGNLGVSKVFDLFYLSDPYMLLQTLFAGALLTLPVWIGGLIILLFYALLGGRSFCSWVCPVNIISDAAVNLRAKFGISPEYSKTGAYRNARYGILLMSLPLSVWLGVSAFEAISPVGIITRVLYMGMSSGAGLIFIVFLFDLLVLKNGWCGRLCPVGGAYAQIGRFSALRIQHNAEACTLCNKCFVACPEPQVLARVGVSTGPVKNTECTLCARCIEVCDDNAMKFNLYSLPKLLKQTEK